MRFQPGMKGTCVLAAAAMIVATGWPAAAESAIFDRSGRLTSLVYSGNELAVRGQVQIPSPDGSRVAEPVAAATRGADRASYQGVIATVPGKTARVRQTVSEEGGRQLSGDHELLSASKAGSGRLFAIPERRIEHRHRIGHHMNPSYDGEQRTMSPPWNRKPRRSAKVTHFCSFKLPHTKNTIWRRANSGPALSSTPQACGVVSRHPRRRRA
jgi:hypothetical protein